MPCEPVTHHPNSGSQKTRLDDLQPSQLLIHAGRLERMMQGMRERGIESFPPVPVKRLGTRLVLTDGHTRAVAAHRLGARDIATCREEDELDFKAYRICVRWCRSEGVHRISDLAEREVDEETWERDWLGRCRRLHEQLAAQRAAREDFGRPLAAVPGGFDGREHHLYSDLTIELTRLYGDRLRSVKLVGSRARGTAREDSDYDVLVLLGTCDMESEVPRLQGLAAELGRRHGGAELSLSPLSAEQLEDLDAKHPGIRDEFRRDAITLWPDAGAGAVTDAFAFLEREVTVVMDRPLGSRHPREGFVYPVNYGSVPGTHAADGHETDAYVLGVDGPLDTFTGTCIAVIERLDDVEDKLVVAPAGTDLDDREILGLTRFQERFFTSRIVRAFRSSSR